MKIGFHGRTLPQERRAAPTTKPTSELLAVEYEAEAQQQPHDYLGGRVGIGFFGNAGHSQSGEQGSGTQDSVHQGTVRTIDDCGGSQWPKVDRWDGSWLGLRS